MNRLKRKIKCFFGLHAPNTIYTHGDHLIQRCLYCDKVIMKMENREQAIRRVK